MSKAHFFSALIIVFFSSIGCFYYIRLVKILAFVKTENSSFWLGTGTKSIEFYLAFLVVILSAFLLRPNLLVDVAALAALSLA
jgi:NADH:ubiquinone oxidoreductase subunit 2 (subunit N)